MKYFLRYTSNAELDLERGTSVHFLDEAEDHEDAIRLDNGGWGVLLSGLCAHSVEGDDEEGAIEDAIETVLWARENSGASGNYPEGCGYEAYLFEGKECEEDCSDGVLFMPTKIIVNVSELADNEKKLTKAAPDKKTALKSG